MEKKRMQIKPKGKVIRKAEPVKQFAMPLPSQTQSQPIAQPVQTPMAVPVQQTPPMAQIARQTQSTGKVVKPMKIRVDLTQLIANGFANNIMLTGGGGVYVATVHLTGNDMYISGEGSNVMKAVEDLNQKVIDLNFEM